MHEESGATGGGLRELYLGPGCSIPLAFLRTLPTSAPRLTKCVHYSLALTRKRNLMTDYTGSGSRRASHSCPTRARTHSRSTCARSASSGPASPRSRSSRPRRSSRKALSTTFSPCGPFPHLPCSLTNPRGQQLCPHLESLHLRSDHITFAFFQALKVRSGHPDKLPLESLAVQYRLPAGEAIVRRRPSARTFAH